YFALCCSYQIRRHRLCFPTRRSSDLGDSTFLLIVGGKTVRHRAQQRCRARAALRGVVEGQLTAVALAQHAADVQPKTKVRALRADRKSTRLNSSHVSISYDVFCLK